MAMEHASVLLSETLDFLAPRPMGRYLDGTVGLGGHAAGIMERSGGQAQVLGLDRDGRALERAAARLAVYGDRVRLAQSAFSDFAEALADLGWDGLDGALVDLGVSSLQLDDAARGFSFLADGPLDMRMNPDGPEAPASVLVNTAGYEELRRIIGEYGEEPMAGRIARAIVEAREQAPIETTAALANLVYRAYPAKWRRTARNHPATRAFQALRIATNDELGELERFLDGIVGYLRPGGRIAVISFHSLEDRIVKNRFREEAKTCVCPSHVLRCACGKIARLKILTKKPLIPTEDEVRENSRARSAKLRVAERLPEPARGGAAR
jgi:16S rRNA (cytosine1402-N4)-methyltransferase